MSQDYFEFFGLPRSLVIDARDLETRFYALSRRHHPDLHSRRGPEERASAEEATALLNDAYRVLRDPIARASYLLKLEGFDIGEQTTKDVPPELLEEVFDLNVTIEELRGGADGDVLPQLEASRRRFEAMRGEIDSAMDEKFSQWDAGRTRDTLVEIRGLLNRRKYITNLMAQTNAATSHVPDRV
jgi:molecular chaperone HscB